MGNKKSATVVGDVVGKYRPSGTSLGYCNVPENKQCGPSRTRTYRRARR